MVCDFVCVKYIPSHLFWNKDKKKKTKRGEENVKVAVEKSAVLCCANHSWTDCIALAD